ESTNASMSCTRGSPARRAEMRDAVVPGKAPRSRGNSPSTAVGLGRSATWTPTMLPPRRLRAAPGGAEATVGRFLGIIGARSVIIGLITEISEQRAGGDGPCMALARLDL